MLSNGSIWFKHDLTWLPHGSHMVPHDFHMIPHCFNMVPTWLLHGFTWFRSPMTSSDAETNSKPIIIIIIYAPRVPAWLPGLLTLFQYLFMRFHIVSICFHIVSRCFNVVSMRFHMVTHGHCMVTHGQYMISHGLYTVPTWSHNVLLKLVVKRTTSDNRACSLGINNFTSFILWPQLILKMASAA